MKIAEFLCLAAVLPIEISFKFPEWDRIAKAIIEKECPETGQTYKLTKTLVEAFMGSIRLLPWEKFVKLAFAHSIPGQEALFIISLTGATISGKYSREEMKFLQRLFKENTIIIEGKEFSVKELLRLDKAERMRKLQESGLSPLKAEIANLLFSVT